MSDSKSASSPDALAEVFWQNVRGAQKSAPDAPAAALGQRLLELWRDGQRAWPNVDLMATDLAAHLAERLPEGSDALTGLSVLHAVDLYLACACVRDRPNAVRAFDDAFIAQVPHFLVGVLPPQSAVEEIQQVLRERFFVAEAGNQPKIAAYSGRGALAGWVRIAAVRTAISQHRGHRSALAVELDSNVAAAGGAPEAGPDPELEYVKRRYRVELREALKLAMARLSHRERNVLRLHFIEGVTLPKLGTLYGAGRSTVARWVANARQRVLDETRAVLLQRLQLTTTEVDSILALVRSGIDTSIREHLLERSRSRSG